MLRFTDTFTVGGCPYMRGTVPNPCVRVQWDVHAQRHASHGDLSLTEESVGLVPGRQRRRPGDRGHLVDPVAGGGELTMAVVRQDYAFPFRIDPASRQAQGTSYETHVKQMVIQLLLTTPGERADLPEFGCGLRGLIFAGNSDAVSATAQMLVQEALGTLAVGAPHRSQRRGPAARGHAGREPDRGAGGVRPRRDAARPSAWM